MKMQYLYIIRGLPGSGKSTLAKILAEKYNFNHLEADMFFMQDGKYIFDRNKLKEAHKWCQEQVEEYLSMGHNVVVSNTFVKLWEIEPYNELAKKYLAEINIIECNGQYQSIHNIPEETIKKMRENWQNAF
jgi:predicted kinase